MQRCRAYQVRFTWSGECLRFRFPSGMAFPLRRPEVSEAALKTLQRVPDKAGDMPREGRSARLCVNAPGELLYRKAINSRCSRVRWKSRSIFERGARNLTK